MKAKQATAITITKEEILRALASLPDPIPVDKLIRTIRLIQKLKQAMVSGEENGTTSHEDFLRELGL